MKYKTEKLCNYNNAIEIDMTNYGRYIADFQYKNTTKIQFLSNE